MDNIKPKANLKERLQALGLSIKWTWESSKKLTFVVLVITFISGLLTIVSPYLFKLIIDKVTGDSSTALGFQIGLSIFSILMIYGVTRVVQSIIWDFQSVIKRTQSIRIDKIATSRMMKKISSLDVEYFENPEYYNTIEKANWNFWRINEFFWQFTFFLGQVISLLVIIGALLTFDLRIVLLIIGSTIPSIILIFKSTNLQWSAFDTSSPIYRHAYYYKSLMTGDKSAIREIKLFGLQPEFLEKFESLFAKYTKNHDKAALRELFILVIIGLVEGILAVLAAWIVIKGFIAGTISIGEFTFLWAILFQFAEHARYSARMIGEMNTNATFTTPFIKIMSWKPKVVEREKALKFPENLKKGIEFRNVSFSYPGEKKLALKNVSFTVNPKESVSLVGENGSGKTTIVKLLTRLYDVDSGEILIDGINIKDYSIKSLYENLGVIFQDFVKYEAAVKENISYGEMKYKAKHSRIHEAAVKAEAWNFIRDLDKKYNTHLGRTIEESGTELSIGQWQKVALARAFFKEAQIMILDEPTAAVDAKAEYELFKKFKSLTKNRTTFLISHRFSTVRMADKIIVMDKGKIVEEGTHHQLLMARKHYAKLFNMQALGYKD